jgi:hypothetical protein
MTALGMRSAQIPEPRRLIPTQKAHALDPSHRPFQIRWLPLTLRPRAHFNPQAPKTPLGPQDTTLQPRTSHVWGLGPTT